MEPKSPFPNSATRQTPFSESLLYIPSEESLVLQLYLGPKQIPHHELTISPAGAYWGECNFVAPVLPGLTLSRLQHGLRFGILHLHHTGFNPHLDIRPAVATSFSAASNSASVSDRSHIPLFGSPCQHYPPCSCRPSLERTNQRRGIQGNLAARKGHVGFVADFILVDFRSDVVHPATAG